MIPRPDELESILHDTCKRLGIKLEVEIATYEDAYRLKARLPVKYSYINLNLRELMEIRGTPLQALDDVLVRLENLQQHVFESAQKHLEKHDTTGRAACLRRIALGALTLADKYMPQDAYEDRAHVENFMKYVKDE